MFKNYLSILYIVAGLIALRLISIVFFPYADTTEPRYAEIARIMAYTGDWITPWFEPGLPFWGKPPLSFWFQAAFIQVFGVAEWTARLPSLLAFLLTLWVVFKCGLEYAGRHAAYWAVAIYATCALPYVSSGAVLTDPYLVLGTTLCMAGLIFPSTQWRMAGFIGLAIGLLAKGPLALVLMLGPVIMCLMVYRTKFWPPVQKSVWVFGILLVGLLVLPWYILAEIKTPGFLDYFIIGEHYKRYVDPGWAGDIYGSAHLKPYGSVWPLWLLATFPWGIVAIIMAMNTFFKGQLKAYILSITIKPITFYYLSWSIFSLIFFTFAGNLLWTYILPAIPAFAILLGKKIAECSIKDITKKTTVITSLSLLLVPSAVLILTIGVLCRPELIKTEKNLAQYTQEEGFVIDELWYINNRPFSARYYSSGKAKLVQENGFADKLKAHKTGNLFLAIPYKSNEGFEKKYLNDVYWHAIPQGSSRRFRLIHLHLGIHKTVASITS